MTVCSLESPLVIKSNMSSTFSVVSHFLLPFLFILTSSTRVSCSLGPYATIALSELVSHAVAVMLLTENSSGLLQVSYLIFLRLRIFTSLTCYTEDLGCRVAISNFLTRLSLSFIAYRQFSGMWLNCQDT